jgi:hypothetical protein
MEPQILLSRLNTLAPEYLDFILSDFTEEAARSVQEAGFRVSSETVLENGIFLYLTLFLHKFSLIEFIITECDQSVLNACKITDVIFGMMPKEMLERQAESALALQLNDDLIKEKDRFTIIDNNVKLLNQYLYLKTGDFTNNLGEKYFGMNSELLEHFKALISDVALGFYRKEDTVPLLQQELGLDPKSAALLGTEVLDMFEVISKDSWTPPTTVNQTPSVTPVVHDNVLPELRTMAADMMEERSPVRSTFNPIATLDEPIYQSTQPTIEKKVPGAPSYTAPLYQPPKPNVDAPLEKPRWG